MVGVPQPGPRGPGARRAGWRGAARATPARSSAPRSSRCERLFSASSPTWTPRPCCGRPRCARTGSSWPGTPPCGHGCCWRTPGCPPRYRGWGWHCPGQDLSARKAKLRQHLASVDCHGVMVMGTRVHPAVCALQRLEALHVHTRMLVGVSSRVDASHP